MNKNDTVFTGCIAAGCSLLTKSRHVASNMNNGLAHFNKLDIVVLGHLGNAGRIHTNI